MSIPAQYEPAGYPGQHEPYGTMAEPGLPHPAPEGGWPANELEEVLSAALGDPGATARVIEVVGRSSLWVPLPDPDGPDGPTLDLPGIELAGAPYAPTFSSEDQFRRAAPGMPFGVVPAREFARGLPPGVGIAINPGGSVGIPLTAAAVAELCRDGAATGGRVRLWEPSPEEEPVDFLAAVAGEFAITPVVLTARRGLASVEGEPPTLFIGVELDRWQEEDRAAAMNAIGRALGVVPVPWTVNLLLLDVAQDPLGDWMHDRVRPFFARD